ncbi:MAG: low-specificity L-threonine aldolase [Rhodobacteraceae bacterium]|nr:low-specificity L-threonine aldolase [Paracoccaceae bacterium]
MSQYKNIPRARTNALCDLRSDTVTRPDAGMFAAIAAAEVGDDVYGEDPSVNALEQKMAELLGKEAAVFFPSGTQSNLAAIMAHCGRGDEVIVGDQYHIYHDEAAGASVLAGVSLCPIPTRIGGEVSPTDIAAALKVDDPHYAISRLLCLENTVSGRAISLAKMTAAAQVAKTAGLAVHLDGARFFNAVTVLGCAPKELADCTDTVSVCLSKGLGAPVGSVLVGSHKLMAKARRHRKILGGAMRQAGVLAAAGLYALEHNLPHLADDHARAEKLAKNLRKFGDAQANSNMVYFTPPDGHHAPLLSYLAAQGVLIGGQIPAIRMVLHRDISDAALDAAIASFQSYFAQA